jgi:thymidylate synthase, flavin-dependent
MLSRIEGAGRTCYKSEEKITTESAIPFVRRIIKSGHESVIEHEVLSVRFICDRAVTHEWVRHRLASFSQESTRYCDYGKMGIKFIIPSDFELDQDDLELLARIEAHYNKCLNEKHRSPQQARYFLPNGLKTEIVVTANLREWRHILRLRTSKAAHPDMRALMHPLLAHLVLTCPVFFEDIGQQQEEQSNGK